MKNPVRLICLGPTDVQNPVPDQGVQSHPFLWGCCQRVMSQLVVVSRYLFHVVDRAVVKPHPVAFVGASQCPV